jgi:hypothetical protein
MSIWMRSSTALRACAAVPIVFTVGFLPVAAVADPYPLPYATVSKETFTTQNTTPASTVTVYAIHVPGSVGVDFYDPRYALRAATYLNEMAAASNSCRKSEYDLARRALARLLNEAGVKADDAYGKADKTAYQSAGFIRYAHAQNDENSLIYVERPPYQGCAQAARPQTEVRIGVEGGPGWVSTKFEDLPLARYGLATAGFEVAAWQYLNHAEATNFGAPQPAVKAGFMVSVIGTDISAAPAASAIKVSTPVMIPFDAMLGVTFAPSPHIPYPVTTYAFAGPILADEHVNAGAFSGSDLTVGGSVGVGLDVEVSPGVDLGAKFRWFSIPNTDINVFPGGSPSTLKETGAMTSVTLSIDPEKIFRMQRELRP